MDVRGVTRVELLIVGLIAITVIGVDVFAFWFLGQKTHDLQTLADVQQIRAGLEAYAAKTTLYPEAAEITPLNDAYSNTEKLCSDGFVRFTKECDKVIMPFIPNSYADLGERYLYRSASDGRDYQLQFEIRSNFVETEIQKGIHCATSAGIVNQPCF